jgi:hypothetical protein
MQNAVIIFKAPGINETPRCFAGWFADYMNVLLSFSSGCLFIVQTVEPESVTLVHLALIDCFGNPFRVVSSTNKL